MATPKLSAPVGAKPRSSNGPAVKNKPADVELLRQMLRANGYSKISDGKKVDSQLLKVIEAQQKKQGFKSPDQVVDPGGKTFKSLVAKYTAAQKKEPPPKPKEDIKVLTFTFKGTKYEVLKEHYDPARAYLVKKLEPMVHGRVKFGLALAEIYHEAQKRADVKKDFWMAVSHDWIGAEKAMPKAKTYQKAMDANNLLLSAYRSGDLKKLEKAYIESNKTIKKFDKEVSDYLKKLNSGAETGLKIIDASRTVSFAILAAVAAPALVAASAMTLPQALAVSAVGAKVIRSSAEELEKHASGQKVNVSSAVNNIAIDGIIETLTQGIIGKVDSSAINKHITKVMPRVSKYVQGISSKHLHPMVRKFASTTGESVVQEVMKQGLTLAGESAKKGKAPSKKDYDKSISDLLYTALSSSFLKQITDYEANYKADYGNTIRKTVIPNSMKRLQMSGSKIPKSLEKKMVNQAYQKVSDVALKWGYDNVVNVYTGKENAAKLNKKMQVKLSKDKAIAAKIDRELLQFAKKHKLPVKP